MSKIEKYVPVVGDTANFYVCGTRYEHVVLAVYGPNKILIAQGTYDNVFGPSEVFTRRKNGHWVKVGTTERSGYATISRQ